MHRLELRWTSVDGRARSPALAARCEHMLAMAPARGADYEDPGVRAVVCSCCSLCYVMFVCSPLLLRGYSLLRHRIIVVQKWSPRRSPVIIGMPIFSELLFYMMSKQTSPAGILQGMKQANKDWAELEDPANKEAVDALMVDVIRSASWCAVFSRACIFVRVFVLLLLHCPSVFCPLIVVLCWQVEGAQHAHRQYRRLPIRFRSDRGEYRYSRAIVT